MADLPRVYRSAETGKYHLYPEDRSFTGALVTPDDVSAIEAVTILDEVLGLARPQYRLRALCRPIRMDTLERTIDVATSLAGMRKVPPMVEAEISAQAFTPVVFALWKNVTHVVVVDEAGMKARHDILAMSTADAARDLARMENLDVKDAVEAATEKVAGTVYADWGASSGGVSTNDPFAQISPSLNYIEGKGYEPNFMAMHPTLWRKFITNTWVRELVAAGMTQLGAGGGSFSLPGWPTIRVVVDYALTETPTGSVGPIIGSTTAPALVLGEGPTVAARYRNEKAGYDAYIIRQWLQPQIVLQDAIDMICT